MKNTINKQRKRRRKRRRNNTNAISYFPFTRDVMECFSFTIDGWISFRRYIICNGDVFCFLWSVFDLIQYIFSFFNEASYGFPFICSFEYFIYSNLRKSLKKAQKLSSYILFFSRS